MGSPDVGQQAPAFPTLGIEALDGEERIRAEQLLAQVALEMVATVEAFGDDELDMVALRDQFTIIGIRVADAHGDLGRLAFKDALRLGLYMVRLHAKLSNSGAIGEAISRTTIGYPPVRDPEV